MPEHQLTRRSLLKLLLSSLSVISLLQSPAGADQTKHAGQGSTEKTRQARPTVGIALGGGGANGLAHIMMLEALDELSIRPHRIAGTSIGAIIGSLYASGMSGKQIRELVEQFIIRPEESLVEELLNKDALRWIEFLEVDLDDGSLLSSEGFIAFLYDTLEQDTFEQLQISLKITAANLWSRQQVVLQSGELIPAIRASMAIPGLLPPVVIDDQVLIDGGTVNPVPYDLLVEECDIVIAIDVIGERTKPQQLEPGYFETIFNAAKVMQHGIMTEKLRKNRPSIYIKPQIVDIRVLEFYRIDEVFSQSLAAKQRLKQQLTRLLVESNK